MAELIKVADNHVGYFDIMQLLMDKGVEQNSRNGNTLEIQDLIIELESPEFASPAGVRPGYNPAIGLVEGLQLLAGVSDPGLTADIQPQFRAYMDGYKFHGAYGPRVVDQLPAVVEKLTRDNDTRQAVVTLWDPALDSAGGKKDHPCTTSFFFLIRDGKLQMKTVMRSMDLYWGWPYDAVQFSMLHQAVAAAVGVRTGAYTHHAVSAHLYEPHWEAVIAMLRRREYIVQPDVVRTFGPTAATSFEFSSSYTKWIDIRDQARQTLAVAAGTLSADALKNDLQREFATTLLTRKAKVVEQNLKKLTS